MARKALLFLGLNAIGLVLFSFTINRSNAQSLDNSNKDYHDGVKRFAAVKKKVTPHLKKVFENKFVD